jgi:superfamily II helicase
MEKFLSDHRNYQAAYGKLLYFGLFNFKLKNAGPWQVDEVHTVGDVSRGACLEACVCRMYAP